MASGGLSGLLQQFRRAVEIVGAVGIKERVQAGPFLWEVDSLEAITRGPHIDLADSFIYDCLPQRIAQPYRPQADNRMRSSARRGAGQVSAVFLLLATQTRDEIARQKRRIGWHAD